MSVRNREKGMVDDIKIQEISQFKYLDCLKNKGDVW